MILTPANTVNIHQKGGTILGTCRGHFDDNKIRTFLQERQVKVCKHFRVGRRQDAVSVKCTPTINANLFVLDPGFLPLQRVLSCGAVRGEKPHPEEVRPAPSSSKSSTYPPDSTPLIRREITAAASSR